MSHPAVRFTPREHERRQLVQLANDLMSVHGALDPAVTPEAVFDALHTAHDSVRLAVRIHDRHHST